MTAQISEQTGHLPGVAIAIMGCIVNGVGEMADADFGYVGGAPGKVKNPALSIHSSTFRLSVHYWLVHYYDRVDWPVHLPDIVYELVRAYRP